MGPGEKARRRRYRERKLAEHNVAMDAFAAAGANCGNCQHRGRHSHFGPVCDLKSDWEGYVRVTLDYLCATHKRAALSGQKEGAREHMVR